MQLRRGPCIEHQNRGQETVCERCSSSMHATGTLYFDEVSCSTDSCTLLMGVVEAGQGRIDPYILAFITGSSLAHLPVASASHRAVYKRNVRSTIYHSCSRHCQLSCNVIP